MSKLTDTYRTIADVVARAILPEILTEYCKYFPIDAAVAECPRPTACMSGRELFNCLQAIHAALNRNSSPHSDRATRLNSLLHALALLLTQDTDIFGHKIVPLNNAILKSYHMSMMEYVEELMWMDVVVSKRRKDGKITSRRAFSLIYREAKKKMMSGVDSRLQTFIAEHS